jgi:dihydroorotase
VHIAHLSTAGAVRLVRDAKARGVRVTAEVTPHHLLLTEDAVRSFDANAKMNPPLRSKHDAEVLLEALVDGTIDCVATDHAPHAGSEKEGEFDRAAFGIVGLETAVGLMLDRLVRPGALPLATLISRLSRDPARLLGLPGGHLAAVEDHRGRRRCLRIGRILAPRRSSSCATVVCSAARRWAPWARRRGK